MNYSTYKRSVEINLDLQTITDFVSQTPNLPSWTAFFVSVGQQTKDDYHIVETKIGKALTRIEFQSSSQGKQFLLIQSRFGEKLETAKIELLSLARSTVFTFHMNLPKHLSSEKVNHMLASLQSELYSLKNLLEQGK